MSIYRPLIDEGPTFGSGAASSAAFLHLRRAQPANEPLPGTMKWIARLPRNIRPMALLRTYPRIANALTVAWPDREAFRAYLYDLLIDRRGNRQGFPADVLRELLALRLYFDAHCYPYGYKRDEA